MPGNILFARYPLLGTALHCTNMSENAVHLPHVLQRNRHLDRLEVRDARILNNLGICGKSAKGVALNGVLHMCIR